MIALRAGSRQDACVFPARCGSINMESFSVEIEGQIRVELIREARIDLDRGARPAWSPVDCLSLTDCWAEKLLANSDRWADRQFLSRDLIDLGALRWKLGPVSESVWRKTEAAYKTAVRDDLRKALSAFGQDSAHQQRCFEGLQVDNPEEIRQGLTLLEQDIARW